MDVMFKHYIIFQNIVLDYIAVNIKKKDMINVITKECIEYGRNVQALYNFSEYSVRLYCSKHKKKGYD